MSKCLAKYLLAALLCFAPLLCWGEGKIFTKKARLADFSTKTTKVVLSGSSILDATLSDEIMTRWRISPFEFCTVEEFEALKGDPSYYFLRLVTAPTRAERNSGIVFLSLMKGGRTDSRETLDASFEVIRIPFAASGESTGREFIYMPAFIDIIQSFVEDSIVTEGTAYLGLGGNAGKMIFKNGTRILISEEDLCERVSERSVARRARRGIEFTSTYAVDSTFLSGAAGVLVGVVMTPMSPGKGARSYQMLISADTHELYYYSRRPYSDADQRGFRREDLRLISYHK